MAVVVDITVAVAAVAADHMAVVDRVVVVAVIAKTISTISRPRRPLSGSCCVGAKIMANTAKVTQKAGPGGLPLESKIFSKDGVSPRSGVSSEDSMYSLMRVVAWFTWLRAFHWCRQLGVLSKISSQRSIALKSTAPM